MPTDEKKRLSRELELSYLREENQALQEEVDRLRNSSIFRLREKLLPADSWLQRLFLAIRTGGRAKAHESISYSDWIGKWDTLTDEDRSAIRKSIESMKDAPLISVVMPVYNAPKALLVEAIESVTKQLYARWELCICDDASTEPYIRPLLEQFAQKDSRIKVHFREENGHISLATNDAIALATGEYIGLLDNDDVLAEHALYCVAKTIGDHPNAKLIYSDEDKIDDHGNRFAPVFKPDWDPLFLLSCNYTCHFSVYHAKVGQAIGWMRKGVEGAQDWDLVLRFSEQVSSQEIVHIPHVLYHWRAHAASTAKDIKTKPYVVAAQQKAVEDTLTRRGEEGGAMRIDRWGVFRYSFRLREPLPKVSVIVHAPEEAAVLPSLLSVTEYPNYEVIVVGKNSITDEHVSVIGEDVPLNHARAFNRGVTESSGEILAFLDSGLQVIEPNWLYRLAAYAVRPEVGAVGSRFIDEVEGLFSAGYLAQSVVDHHVRQIRVGCLLVSKEHFRTIGGFDEELGQFHYSADFCLKLEERKLNNVYVGSVAFRCLDFKGPSLSTVLTESKVFTPRWAKLLEVDPYRNPNLGGSFELAEEPRVKLPWR